MMSNHEKWEYERNIDEIVCRLSDLLASMILMSIKKINNDQKYLMDGMELDQDNEAKF